MKFPKLFGRKSKNSDDDYDEFDDELDDAPESRGSRSDDDDSVDEDDLVGGSDDDDDDELEGLSGRSNRKMLFVAGGVGLAVVLIVSGAAWWFFGESGEPAPAEAPVAKTTATHVVLEVAPRPQERPAPTTPAAAANMSATDTLNAMAALSTGPGAGIVVKPIQTAVFNDAQPAPKAEPLPPAPNPELVEQSPVGPLPRVSDSGRMPWQAYAKPFQVTEGTPLIAVIFTGLGMNRTTTEAAITYLPAEVTFAIDPYGTNIGDWTTAARKAGHEVLLELPLEPAEFPTRDPGPLALVTDSSTAQNIQRLNFLLSRISGYTGVLTVMGSRFTQNEEQMRPIIDILKQRGLMYVDSLDGKSAAGVNIAKETQLPHGFVDLVLDSTPSQSAINRQLAQLERFAKEKGVAIALAHPYPISVSRIAAWLTSLSRQGITLAPVSAIANRQDNP